MEHSTSALGRAWAALGSTSAFGKALVLVALYRFWFWWYLGRFGGLTGDEAFYFRNARRMLGPIGLSDYDGSIVDVGASVMGRGWFLPGMSFVVAPARVFTDSASAVRLWVGVVSVVLLVVLARRLSRMYSPSVGTLVLLIVGLLPYTAWFSLALWGGHIGGILMVLNLLSAVEIARRIRVGIEPTLMQLGRLGAMTAICVYIRPPTVGQLAPIGLILFMAYFDNAGFGRALWSSVRRYAVVFGLFALVIAPWQAALMIHWEGPFFIVTTRPVSSILRNIEPGDLPEEYGDPPVFGGVHRYVVDLAEERGIGFYEAATSERDRFAKSVTLTERVNRIGRASRRYFDGENDFLGRPIDQKTEQLRGGEKIRQHERISARIRALNRHAWLVLQVSVIALLVRRWRFWEGDGFLGVIIRGSLPMVFLQPLTGLPHGRHISFASVMFISGLAIALHVAFQDQRKREEPFRIRWLEWGVSTAVSLGILGFLALYFNL